HDALAVLSQSKLDWDYLLHRSRKAPRRLLALLIYAQSSDIWIPNHPIQRLYGTIFLDCASFTAPTTSSPTHSLQAPEPTQQESPAAAPAAASHAHAPAHANTGARFSADYLLGQ